MSEKDLLDLLNDPDIDDPDDDEGDGGNKGGDLPELKSLIEDLRKENKGLLQAKQDEKRKRQDNQRRLETIEQKLSTILDTRKSVPGAESPGNKLSGIPVEFTPDGEAFIPSNKLEEWSKPYQEQIIALKDELNATRTDTKASKEADEVIKQVLAEDERFPSVYNQYLKARQWINNQVIEYQKDNDLAGYMSSAQALDKVFDEDLEKKFIESFPGMELESVIIAEDSEKLFRRMLKTHTSAPEEGPQTKITDDQKKRFEKVLKKPAGLGGSANAKGGELSVLDKLESLSQEDILGLSESQVKALEQALREEELRG